MPGYVESFKHQQKIVSCEILLLLATGEVMEVQFNYANPNFKANKILSFRFRSFARNRYQFLVNKHTDLLEHRAFNEIYIFTLMLCKCQGYV